MQERRIRTLKAKKEFQTSGSKVRKSQEPGVHTPKPQFEQELDFKQAQDRERRSLGETKLRLMLHEISSAVRGLLFLSLLNVGSDRSVLHPLKSLFAYEIEMVGPTGLADKFNRIKEWQEYWLKRRRQFNSIVQDRILSSEVIDHIRILDLTRVVTERVVARLDGNAGGSSINPKHLLRPFQKNFLEKLNQFEGLESSVTGLLDKNRSLLKDTMKESAKGEDMIEKVRVKEQLRHKQIDHQIVQKCIDDAKASTAQLLRKGNNTVSPLSLKGCYSCCYQ